MGLGVEQVSGEERVGGNADRTQALEVIGADVVELRFIQERMNLVVAVPVRVNDQVLDIVLARTSADHTTKRSSFAE